MNKDGGVENGMLFGQVKERNPAICNKGNEGIRLSRISQRKTHQILHCTTSMWTLKKSQTPKKRVEKRLPGLGEVRKREMGKRVQKLPSYKMNKAEHLMSKPW